MEYRDAAHEDVEAIERTARASWEADYPDILSRETAAEAAVEEWYGREAVERELETPGTLALVAEDERGEVVGFSHTVVADGEATILRVYVHPEARGEGVGTGLLEATIAEARSRAAERLRAMVLAANEPGNAFYDSAGFEPVETGQTVIGGEEYEERTYELESEESAR